MPSRHPTSQSASDHSSPLDHGSPLDSYENKLRQALEESNERFKATFEQAAVGIAHVAIDGSWLRINQKLCDILGYTASELKLKTFQDITYPDDLAGDLAYVNQVLNGEIESYSLDKRYFRKSGKVIWVELTVSLVRSPAGDPKYFIAVIRDIDSRKQAEAKFKASEQRFRRAIINAPLPIVICAESGEMLHLSKGWTGITGYGAEEIATIEDWAEKAYGKDKDIFADRIYQVFDQTEGTADRTESTIQTKTGKRTWQFHSIPLGIGENGQKLAMGMAADITELQTAQTELAQKLQQQAMIAEMGQLSISSHDLQALFDLTTQKVAQVLEVEYCKILERSPDRTQLKLVSGVGWRPGTVGHVTVSNALSQGGYTLRSRQPVVVEDLRTESRFTPPPLLIEHQVVSGITTPIYQKEGAIFGILGVHTTQSRRFVQADVDFVQAIANILSNSIERYQAEQNIRKLNQELEERVIERTAQLEDSNEELKAFTYTVSHDLRAPLRAMEGFAQALREDYGPVLDDLGKEYASRIVAAAHQMDSLILDLLSYSQLSRSNISVSHISATQAIEEAIAALTPMSEERQAAISVSDIPMVYGNHSILVQIFTNLLSNAIKFVPLGTQPSVQIIGQPCPDGNRPGRVRIWVKDNGLGIAPEHQQRIFNVFERLHGVETYSGTGIGLAIVKKGAARMGGTVGLTSQIGQGSQFWIELDTDNYCRI
ncbi:MAG: PAS domain S-box protein [Phormidesmis sp.]